jgi:hypothetical protein
VKRRVVLMTKEQRRASMAASVVMLGAGITLAGRRLLAV